MFFHDSSIVVVALLILIVGGTAAATSLAGARLRDRAESHHTSVGVVQGTLLGLIGLLLAFGLTMAVGRYESRRALLVQEANDIGTTYLRAQLLPEPMRTNALDLLREYGDAAIDLADEVPDDEVFQERAATMESLQNDLWNEAAMAVAVDPTGTAPRLFVETLNAMIDTHTDRVASLRNRVPSTVVMLQVAGSAIALGVLGLYLSLLGRGVATALIAASVVILTLFISFDLDRPHRGMITVPFGPLEDVGRLMDAPPAYDP